MKPQISAAAGELWLAVDRRDGIFKEILMKEMQDRGRPAELALMALGWLVYEGYVRWVPGERGGRLYLMSRRKEAGYEESNQNRFAAHGA